MCGISGIFAFNAVGRQRLSNIDASVRTLQQRGPDFSNTFLNEHLALGHTRLSIIDTSKDSNQPFIDPSGRYVLVFNGELYNFGTLRRELELQEAVFSSKGDTEVLLHLLIKEGEGCLNRLNGFFAFAFYDQQENTLLLARDRYGIKPLHFYLDQDHFLFASEIKALLPFGISKQIDQGALHTYLQLSYVPAPYTMYQGIFKMEPGQYLQVTPDGRMKQHRYYELIKQPPPALPSTYSAAKTQLRSLLEQSVEKRMIADVPVGTFLSGGIDSSIISLLASSMNPHLNTFSVGFKDEPYFDESRYAEMMANKLGTNHITFHLSNDELFTQLSGMLNYQDEPFADSSALAVSYLSQQTKKHVAVALSGDGADEVFTGYNKHRATYFVQNKALLCSLIRRGEPLWQLLPQSRSGKFANLNRQLLRLSKGLRRSPDERYWQWASFYEREKVNDLLLNSQQASISMDEFITTSTEANNELSRMLINDMQLVLPNDMLTKVDRMSMRHGLEVRVPFLDHQVVEFAHALPMRYKITGSHTKRILRETFQQDLPAPIFNRKKHGFEVPLLKWLHNELAETLNNELFSARYIKEQGLFNIDHLLKLKQQLHTNSPGDAISAIWSLFVFNHWWKKNNF
jgi:asparagine synthase (glutamine-hydrolysing)